MRKLLQPLIIIIAVIAGIVTMVFVEKYGRTIRRADYFDVKMAENQNKPISEPKKSETSETDLLLSFGRKILTSLKNKSMAGVVDYVNSDKGLDLKPFYSSNSDNGRNISKQDLPMFFNDPKEYLWGYEDGSGLPMKSTNAKYFDSRVYSMDFLNADETSYNTEVSKGNNLPLKSVLEAEYPGSNIRFIEYYFVGTDPQYEGMDWQALALVFEKVGDNWFLISILHNQWTI